MSLERFQIIIPKKQQLEIQQAKESQEPTWLANHVMRYLMRMNPFSSQKLQARKQGVRFGGRGQNKGWPSGFGDLPAGW